MRQKILLKNKLLILVLAGIAGLMLAMPLTAAWDVQPKLGHRMTPLPKPTVAPGFTLEDMDEVMVSLKSLRGKVVLVNFWATWCPPCRREMPSMERLTQKFKDKGFSVVAINQMETGDHVFEFTGRIDLDPTFTILFDKDSKVSRDYKVRGLPTSYLIDKQGNIRYRAIGGREFDHPAVEKQITELMKE